MTTKLEPVTFGQARDSLPLFAVGLEVRVWYMGLLGPDETPGKHRFTTCRIEGMRLAPHGREGWSEEKQEATIEVDYPKGWEYLAVAPDGSEDGWYSEAALLAKGYAPAPSIYDETREALEVAWNWMEPYPGDSADQFADYEKVRKVIEKLKVLAQLRKAAGQ
jgi:hypothetical protein